MPSFHRAAPCPPEMPRTGPQGTCPTQPNPADPTIGGKGRQAPTTGEGEPEIMSMTRKDFQAIAQVIAANRAEVPDGSLGSIEFRAALNKIAKDLARLFVRHNEGFDRNKFLEACQGGQRATGAPSS